MITETVALPTVGAPLAPLLPPSSLPQVYFSPLRTTELPTTERVHYPIISEDEVASLSQRFGTPQIRRVHLIADDSLAAHRFRSNPDRRAEVIFVIENSNGVVWVHAKKNYPNHTYRLPSGGIDWDESVEAALYREIAEETGLPVTVQGFLGVIDYTFHYRGRTAQFASYVFHVLNHGGLPHPTHDEEITAFQAILPSQLLQISADLRNLIGDRHAWGQYRAIAHDVAYETLTK